ncbi:RagB/SusD family nutrient uptake outer membrane protein [Mucilaginibacter sp. BJC16-A38]|uniref:RagB/SusD family nutrient uptake outer membrane protein n=1 Tax=Mucilaginibacter phenanthrenivorans TaxID=1234842 RepID=UPI002157AAFF|nr:RagB/SusD family nutrient uptake outer membrane protein [Mucilaginibacter phenanthrenivorans]MCR8556932.1 RagB/SusD family nutrient uptake outer membrane protein [Mucilaginibacter phenanthrenivorans]
MKTNQSIYFRLLGFMLLVLLSACKKLVEIPPSSAAINSDNVYNNNATAASVLNGIYGTLSAQDYNASSVPAAYEYLSLSADELVLYDRNNPTLGPFYRNALSPSLGIDGQDPWVNCYPVIFQANDVIRGVTASANLSLALKQQLLGEAYFVRAYCYFYLVNLYGDVPLVTGTDFKINSVVARAPKDMVWQQIVADLKLAATDLSADFLGGDALSASTERTRPTKWAATALLARAYLYNKDYPNAITVSSALISNTAQFSLDSLQDVFLKNSSETIWALQPVFNYPGSSTGEGSLFNLPLTGPSTGGDVYPVYLSNFVLNAFETGDQRKINWVNQATVGGVTYNYPYKYKAGRFAPSLVEYAIQFRLAEQYLIRAEAEVSSDPAAAVRDLNVIRSRAGLPGYTGAMDNPSLLTAILHERQVELFTENGHRWLDLKRTTTVDAVMSQVSTQKGGTWNTNQQLYPIPLSQILADPNLKQNVGY